MTKTNQPRFVVRAQRVRGAYVINTHTGETYTGLTFVGARQLADYLNRTRG
ncbi:hypothetical protein [Streptomyces sp. CC53]|uniref:hypothetical protein n=1 Tax=Streptomyces sp. CC53 TaxID=1906740 RepID=UPI0015A6AF30|nr:hypothetical protein [Streptomyces sp. CC53]